MPRLTRHFLRFVQGIDEELSLAAEAFLEGDDGCVLNMPKREVSVLTGVSLRGSYNRL